MEDNPKRITDEDVKRDLKSFFTDENHPIYQYGSRSECGPDSPYHRKQIEVLFENKYFHWLIDRNVNSLINDDFLIEKDFKIAKFVYRSDIRYIKREIKKRVEVIKEYTAPHIIEAIGAWGEMLSENMFIANNFKIIDRNTNEYNGKKWPYSNHNLDFIIQKDDITYGVEVKNTLPYMEREEFTLKLGICKYLGIIPLWILRYAPTIQFLEMEAYNGFILLFKSQIYPLGQRPLTERIWKLMRLPVAIWKRFPDTVVKSFLALHNSRK